MGADVRYQRGQHIIVRDVLGGKTRALVPSVVVVDEPEMTVTWVPEGTPVLILDTGVDGHSLEAVGRQAAGTWALKQRVWHTAGLVRITAPEFHWAMLLYSEDDRVKAWYVNLEEPVSRTAEGITISDRYLDIVIEPDRKSWRWKDEDELEEAVRLGIFTPGEAAQFRQDGLDAIARITSGEPPFDTSWADWQPDPEWGIPQLPDAATGDE